MVVGGDGSWVDRSKDRWLDSESDVDDDDEDEEEVQCFFQRS